jgi:HPt (histidine-containing phosphotransfer) domain-containing protein
MPDNAADLDLTFLNEIADGSDEFIVESIGMFLEQSPAILQEIGDAIDAGDWVMAASSAHKIKANLGFFGMNNSHALINEIEAESKTGGQDSAGIKGKFTEAAAFIIEAIAELRKIKAEKEANL